MTRRLAQVFCGGSTTALIAHLLRAEQLSPEDVRELRRIMTGKAPPVSTSRTRKGK